MNPLLRATHGHSRELRWRPTDYLGIDVCTEPRIRCQCQRHRTSDMATYHRPTRQDNQVKLLRVVQGQGPAPQGESGPQAPSNHRHHHLASKIFHRAPAEDVSERPKDQQMEMKQKKRRRPGMTRPKETPDWWRRARRRLMSQRCIRCLE